MDHKDKIKVKKEKKAKSPKVDDTREEEKPFLKSIEKDGTSHDRKRDAFILGESGSEEVGVTLSNQPKSLTERKIPGRAREKHQDDDDDDDDEEEEDEEEDKKEKKIPMSGSNDARKRVLTVAMEHGRDPLKSFVISELSVFQRCGYFEAKEVELVSPSKKKTLTELKVEKVYSFLFVDDAETSAKSKFRELFGNFLSRNGGNRVCLPEALLLLEKMTNESLSYFEFLRQFVLAMRLLKHMTVLTTEHRTALNDCFTTFCPKEQQEFYAVVEKEKMMIKSRKEKDAEMAAKKEAKKEAKKAEKAKKAEQAEQAEKEAEWKCRVPAGLREFVELHGRNPLRDIVMKKLKEYQKSQEFQHETNYGNLSKMTTVELYKFIFVNVTAESYKLSFLSNEATVRESMMLLEGMAKEEIPYEEEFMFHFERIHDVLLLDLPLTESDKEALQQCYSMFATKDDDGLRDFIPLKEAKKKAKTLAHMKIN